jgi:HK97 family phage major capsid protein
VKTGTVFESGQGAGLIPVPQVIPGVVDKLFEPLSVVDLIPNSQATTSSLRYVNEGTATNAAAGVAEGGTKPASDLAYSTIDEPVKKIATVLTVSDELLDDAPQIQQYLNSRLGLFVRLEEERQVLRGAGGNELVGIFGRAGVNTYNIGSDTPAVGIYKALVNTRGSANLAPSGIVMHPVNYASIRRGTATTGEYLAGYRLAPPQGRQASTRTTSGGCRSRSARPWG